MDSELLAILLLIANGVAISFLVKYPIRQWLGIEKKPKERDFYDSETHDQLISTRIYFGVGFAGILILLWIMLSPSPEQFLVISIIITVLQSLPDVYYEWKYKRETRQRVITSLELLGLLAYIVIVLLTDGFGLFNSMNAV